MRRIAYRDEEDRRVILDLSLGFGIENHTYWQMVLKFIETEECDRKL